MNNLYSGKFRGPSVKNWNILFLFFLFLSVTQTADAQQTSYQSQLFSSSENLFTKGPSAALMQNSFDMDNTGSLDLLPPIISFTPLQDVCTLGNRVLTATITDVDGVPTSGSGLPVLYFRINSGPWNPVTAVSLGANQYSFTFGGAAVQGNIISYYIVAQDNAGTPNVGAQPSAGAGGFTANPPAAATPPTSPNFYVIQPTLAAGTYLVGPGQVYTTITDAVNAYNNACLSGPVVFALTSTTYTELTEFYPITIYNPSASATNTLTIKPNTGISTTISGVSSEALFKLYGADYIIFEGSNNFTATRNMTILNTGTDQFSSCIWLGSQSSTNGATNNIIRNCILRGNSGITAGSNTHAGIISGSGVNIGFPADAPNSNNLYRNNLIDKLSIGINLIGGATNDNATTIELNSIGSSSSLNHIGFRGIQATSQSNLIIRNNTVFNITSNASNSSETDPTAGIILTGAINGATINANIVNTIRNINVAGWHSFGICMQSSSNAANVNITNNMIYAITSNGNALDPIRNGHGISILSGGGYNIYHNAVNMATNQPLAGITSCFYIGTGVTALSVLNIRNNIFSNRMTTGARYAIYSMAPNTVFSQIDYNCYYSTQRVGFMTVNQANLAAWQAATGSDLNSNVANPIFIAANNLRLNLISPLNDLGTPIPSVTSDIDGVDVRSPTTPDIGCDEISPPPCAGNNPGTVTVNKTTLCYSGTILLASTGFDIGLGISYQWESSPDNVTFTAIPGETNPTSGTPPAVSSTTYFRLRISCSFTGGVANYSNVVTVTVQSPAVNSSTPGTRCGPGTVGLSATGSTGTTINWYEQSVGGEILGTGTNFTTPSISTNTTYYAEAAFPGSNGSVGPSVPITPLSINSVQFTSWKVFFNVLQPTKLISVDVYPLAAGQPSTLTVNRPDGSLVAAIPYVTAVDGGATAQVILINVTLDPGIGYYLYTTNNDQGLPTNGLRRDISGAVYPYVSSDIEITSNEFNNTYYMCYYRWRFSNACATSPRTSVLASITSGASLSVAAAPATLCIGSSTTLTASSANTSFTYNWMPGNLSGTSITVSPSSNTKYVVTGTDGTCISKDSLVVNVVSAPSNIVSTPAGITKCGTEPPVAINASGGITQINLFSEDFNAGDIPAGWEVTNSGPNSNFWWNVRPNNWPAPGYFLLRSPDSSPFLACWSSGNNSNKTNRIKTTPFSTVGITNASLTFSHHYVYFGTAPDSILIEGSLNGTSGWFKLRSWAGPLSVGNPTAFKRDTVVLPAGLLNVPSVYLRFNYFSRDNFGWAIDNISVTGNDQQMPITWSPTTGLFTNAAGTIPYTGGNAPIVYANPATTTDYYVSAIGVNSCEKRDTTTVTIRPPVTGVISGSTAVCPFGAAPISITLTGTAPWSLTYTDGSTPVTVTGILTSPYVFTVNPAVTTTFSITALADANCTAPPAAYAGSATVTVNPTLFSTWLGLSTDWTDPTNWCGGVPTSVKDVVIPGSLPFYPVVTNTLPVTRNLQIESGATLTITASGMLGISGDMVNDGTLNNQGVILLNGSAAQSFPGGSGNITAMHTLEVNKPSGAATINRKFGISYLFKPTAGNIILTDTVTIASNASGTASIDKVGATASFTYNGAGKFRVERYIPSGLAHGKTWQLLSAPTTGQTVNQAWQEGAASVGSNPHPGYGTTFSSDVAGALGLGFDFYTPSGGPSIKVYNSATNQYVGIPNTNSLPIANSKGYMLFVRGDRSVNTSVQPAVPVTLRTTGKVYAPGADAPPSVPVLPNKLESVGNPYASSIDFINLLSTSTGLDTKYYVWDPLLPGSYGLGGFQTISSTNGYIPIPGNTLNYPTGIPYTRVQSGQAFFVFSTPGGTVNFSENNKVVGSQQVFRPGNMDGRQFMRSYLFTSSGTIADGNVVAFDKHFSNAFDEDDAIKLGNVGENFGVMSKQRLLAVDARQPIIRKDTVFYQLSNLRNNNTYRFQFVPENLISAPLRAYLVDQYTGREIPVSLGDETEVSFDINSDAASRNPDRFYIVFEFLRPVPVTILQIDARKDKNGHVVNWTVENEVNILQYEIERSENGKDFLSIGNLKAASIPGYQWQDSDPVPGMNFYRIRAVGTDGQSTYSKIVSLSVDMLITDIVVYPNPVKNNVLGLLMHNQPEGNFICNLYNQSGQLAYTNRFYYAGGTFRVKMPLHTVLAQGVYRLEMTNPKKQKTVRSIVID